jgi:hypothetical protein
MGLWDRRLIPSLPCTSTMADAPRTRRLLRSTPTFALVSLVWWRGVAYALSLGWDWSRIGRFANAIGALSTPALGAQALLPGLAKAYRLIGNRMAAPASIVALLAGH